MVDDSVMKRFFDAWDSLDPEVVVGLYAEDGIHEDVANGAVARGRDAIKAFVLEAAKVSSPTRTVITTEHWSGDSYATEWEVTGAWAATNKAYRLRGVSVGRVDASGKVTENHD
jgi:uncharacterized protein (TIGR02246 family)